MSQTQVTKVTISDCAKALDEIEREIEKLQSDKKGGGAHLFSVTPEGDDYIAQHSPKPPKLTRGQQRYRDYLKVADCFESFGSYLKYKAHQARHGA